MLGSAGRNPYCSAFCCWGASSKKLRNAWAAGIHCGGGATGCTAYEFIPTVSAKLIMRIVDRATIPTDDSCLSHALLFTGRTLVGTVMHSDLPLQLMHKNTYTLYGCGQITI